MPTPTPPDIMEARRTLSRGALRIIQFGSVHNNGITLNYIALAIYLGQLEGRPFDLSSLASFLMLPRSTVGRKVSQWGGSGPGVTFQGKGRRLEVGFGSRTPDQQRRVREYFLGLERIFRETCQALDKLHEEQSKFDDLT